MANGKNFSGWVPGTHVEKAERLIRAKHGGNQSEFVAGLVIAAVEGAPPSIASDKPLLEMAKQFHPTLADELAPLLEHKKVNQKRAIARLLEAFTHALRDAEFDPSSEISLVDRKTREEWQAMSTARILLAASELAAGLNEKGAAALLTARNALVHGIELDVATKGLSEQERKRTEELYNEARNAKPPAKKEKGSGKVAGA